MRARGNVALKAGRRRNRIKSRENVMKRTGTGDCGA